MSVTFVPPRQQPQNPLATQAIIKKMLDENAQLIQIISDYQTRGKITECLQYQHILHRNMVYLANLADSCVSLHSLLPSPGNQIQSDSLGQMMRTPGQSDLVAESHMSDQSYPRQQEDFPTQNQNKMNHQPMISQNHSVMTQNRPDMFQSQMEMSENLSVMSCSEADQQIMTQNQQSLSHTQPEVSHTQTVMVQHSPSLESVSGMSDQMTLIHSVDQQSGYEMIQPCNQVMYR